MNVLVVTGLFISLGMIVVGGTLNSEDCNKNPKMRKIGKPLLVSGVIIFFSLEVLGVWRFP